MLSHSASERALVLRQDLRAFARASTGAECKLKERTRLWWPGQAQPRGIAIPGMQWRPANETRCGGQLAPLYGLLATWRLWFCSLSTL